MKNLTDITVVLDTSGSMQSIKKDMEGAFNAFIKSQTEVLKDECVVSLYSFNSACNLKYMTKPVQLVPKLEIAPRGCTALYDAMHRAMRDTGTRLASMSEENRPARVVFVVITDGEENSSKTVTSGEVRAAVERQQSVYNWQFMYLGANQDAFCASHRMGFQAYSTKGYEANSAGVGAMFCNVSDALASYRSANSDQLSFDFANKKDKIDKQFANTVK